MAQMYESSLMNESSLTKARRRRLLKQVNPCIPTNVIPRLRLLTRTAGRSVILRIILDSFTKWRGLAEAEMLPDFDAGARKLAKVNLNQ
jgi:hypothetical protein